VVAVGEIDELSTTGEAATVVSVIVCPTMQEAVTVELHAGTLEFVFPQVKTMFVAANAGRLRHTLASSMNSFFISPL
jgi:hypothetical protein